MKSTEIKDLKLRANIFRQQILEMIVKNKDSHIASAFSLVEILVSLYYKILKINPKNPEWENRDRFILSKGHGGAALYVTLAEKGFFPKSVLDTLCQPKSILGGHPDMLKIPGIEASTGSLGHGLPIAIGISLAAKTDRKNYRTYCLVGDGECQEGTIWEAAMCAPQHKLDNLTVIVDYNKLQICGPVSEIVNLEPFSEKWKSFGWEAVEVDGHNIEEMISTLKKVPFKKDKPSVIIAHTVKGKGVSYMENVTKWHSMLPDIEQLKQAKKELKDDEIEIIEN